MSPVTGPVYRYDAETAGPGAFPPYYDGSWFITNRGSSDGFWKEVQLRTDDDKMLRVNDWAPAGQFGSPEQRVRDPEPTSGPTARSTWRAGTRAAAATSSARRPRRSS